MTGWNVESFRLWAEIEFEDNDKRELDVIRCGGQFPLNDIPKFSITVALGRKINDNKPSEIHKILGKMKVKRKVKVYCEAKNFGFFAFKGITAWPADKFLVFEGYTTGAGYQRSPTSADYTLELEHWLADLAYASSVSAVSSPSNPANMTFAALTSNPAESADGTAKAANYTGATSAEDHVDAGTISEDFWGKAILPFFESLASEETLAGTDAASQIGLDLGAGLDGNAPALAALARFEPKIPKRFSVPLSFDPGAYGGDLEDVAGQIEIAMGSETLEALAGSTLWDKLVQYASTFMFAVAPMVERCLVIPFIPSLRKEYLTVKADQYDYIRLNGDMPRVLRGVGIYGGKGFDGGGDFAGGDAVDYDQFSIGGYFQGAKTGQIIFKQAPMWMRNVTLSSESARSSGGDGKPIADGLGPGVGDPPAGAKPKAKAEANGRLMDKFAETMYGYEVLKFRSGDMSGKLRFDIGPGSVIKIEGCGEKFLGVDDQFGQTLFATVLQVDFFLDAEGSKAGTSFHLAHLRNELENSTAGFSTAVHPLWSRPWSGCPLQNL